MARAVSVMALLTKKRKMIAIDGQWKALLGEPELSGVWFVWGPSANGKTTFVLQLCKYLTKFARVAYNSLEEGDSESIANAFRTVGMEAVKSRIVLLDREPIDELTERLKRPKSPDIIVLDSLQYSGLTYPQYKAFKNELRKKLLILISHANGREPAGRTAKTIRYDADIKIRVEGYVASAASRYGGGEPYTVWEKGAELFHGKNE